MDIRIYDVEHGDCILILSSQNEAVLVDCGYNTTTGWRPSEGLAKQGFGERRRLHHLIITHPDQDHLADLPDVLAKLKPLADLPGVLEKLKPLHVWQHPQLYLKNLGELKATLSKAQDAYVARSKSTAELQPIEATRQFHPRPGSSRRRFIHDDLPIFRRHAVIPIFHCHLSIALWHRCSFRNNHNGNLV